MTSISSPATISIGGTPVMLINDLHFTGNLPDLSETDWRDGAAECYSDDVSSVYVFPLGDGLLLYVDTDQGYPEAAEITRHDIHMHLRSWDHDCEDAEWFAQWGISSDPALRPVTEDYDGPCRVWCEPQYYHGTYNAPTAHFARVSDSDGAPLDEIREFADHAEAAAYVADYYSAPSGYDGIPACNVLMHGQAGSDTLTIVAAE